jgi:hypothetical protein
VAHHAAIQDRAAAAHEGHAMKLKIGLLIGLLLAGANAMACYTVYDANSRVVYRGPDAPVDMSQPLREALAARFPGGGASMVFDQGAACTPVAIAQVARSNVPTVPANTIRMERTGRQISPSSPAPSPSSAAPLLTDRQTAQRQNLPYTVMSGDVVMVPGYAAARADLPHFTVVPTDTAVARTAMPPTASMGAGPARAQTVITEMRNPAVTITEQGGNVSVQRY